MADITTFPIGTRSISTGTGITGNGTPGNPIRHDGLNGVIVSGGTSIVTGNTMSIAGNTVVVAIIFANATGSDITVSVGTSSGGTQILDSVVVPAGETDQTETILRFFLNTTTIYFTLTGAGSPALTVKIAK